MQMQRIIKEPLVHFLFIGAVLFLVFSLANDEGPGAADNEIVVTAGRIEQLANIFGKTWQRPPTPAELKGLIDDFVLEEVYYRQAVEMGIDRDDTVIRRRMRQKLEFLTDDVAGLAEATDEELATYLNGNEDKFRRDPIYSFSQVYINPEKHGDTLESDIAEQLGALRAGREVRGDSNLLNETYDRASNRMVDSTFGLGFSRKLDGLVPGEWKGPIESGLGLHLIRLESRIEGTVPALAEIKMEVEREWTNEKRLENRRQLNERLLEVYEVTIEWPERPEERQSDVTTKP